MKTGSNSQQKAVVKKKPKISCYVRKQHEKKKRDIISNLPDTILHHIFSFLDIELAVKTCILSKRWRYLWTTLPHLNFFDHVHLYEKEDTKKLDFVDRVLVLRDTTSNIQSLHFHIISSTRVPPSLNIIKGHLTTWIFAAVKSSVQHLSVQTIFDYRVDYFYGPKKRNRNIKEGNSSPFKFPDCLFTSKTLMSLELKTNSYDSLYKSSNTCLAAAYSIISLPLLKTLHLASLTLVEGDSSSNDSFITKIVSSCPVLESLIIKDCEFRCCSTSINISSLKLKHLEIDKCSMISNSAAAAAAAASDVDLPVEIEFKLNAPNLISFSFTDFMSKDYTLENLSSLLKANIDMDAKAEVDCGRRNNTILELLEEMRRLYAPRMMKFLKALHNVKDLKLSPWFIEVVSGAVDLLEIRPTQFCNLRNLELKTWFKRECIHSIAYLLQICPNIDTLSIEVASIMLDSVNIRDYWEPGLSMECMLYHLKVVKFRGSLGDNELKFLEFLLKNAPVLEKLTVTFNGYGSQKKREREFAEKLHEFPRASSRITIMFF